MSTKGADRHSFTRIPDLHGHTYCLRCGLERRRDSLNRSEYLDRMGWTDRAPSCLTLRAELKKKTGAEVLGSLEMFAEYLFCLLDERTIVRSHWTTLIPRMVRAGLKADSSMRYRVVAAGIDHRNRIISIATNRPRFQTRGQHAEERIIFSSPLSLSRIIICRVGAKGALLPIEPCRLCSKLAARRGIKIESVDYERWSTV